MMKSISTWKQELTKGAHAARLAALYCCTPDETPAQAARYAAVLDGLETTFGAHTEAGLYSAPGRTEIGGNHTDHQHGRVLAGSVNRYDRCCRPQQPEPAARAERGLRPVRYRP